MTEYLPATPLRIVVIEDNPADVFLIRESLKEQGVECELSIAEDGQEAIALVRREEAADGAERLDLIVLDLNLPKYSGKEILQSIRKSPALAQVPVAILTSSDSPQDRLETSNLGANRYIRKPSSLEEFMQVGALLKEMLVR
ncbi:MAG: response regulator [Candidatus Binatia bacterium]